METNGTDLNWWSPGSYYVHSAKHFAHDQIQWHHFTYTYIVRKHANLENAPGWMDSNIIKSVNILQWK